METLGLYPVWYEPVLGSGWVLGVIAVVHVLASHTSVGAALVTTWLATVAVRRDRPELLDYVRRYGVFLLVFSYVLGSITGPGILYKLLLDFREGRIGGTDAGLMTVVAGGLNEQAMADIAAWLGSLPRPRAVTEAVRPPALLAGDRERLIPPCEACHGANGQGWDVQPALTGQNRGYLAGVLTRFKTGERANDLNEGMAQIARVLSDQDIRDLAVHYGR